MANTVHIARAGFGGTPAADSRFAVPRPSDRNSLRNPPRQHVPTVVRQTMCLNEHADPSCKLDTIK